VKYAADSLRLERQGGRYFEKDAASPPGNGLAGMKTFICETAHWQQRYLRYHQQ